MDAPEPAATPTPDPDAVVTVQASPGRYGIAILDPHLTDSPLRRHLTASHPDQET